MARKKSIISNFLATAEWQTVTGDDNANAMTSTYNGVTLEGLGGNDSLTTTLVGPNVSANLSAYQYGGAGLTPST